MKSGDVMGHETTGEVVEVGKNNKKFKVSDRVPAPWLGTNCSHCSEGSLGWRQHPAGYRLWLRPLQKLDVFTPDGAKGKKLAVLLFVHGGDPNRIVVSAQASTSFLPEL
jgi:D-arabinose 1-dehydrogenase-like Zn-dependent alcohol dehydrogenase